MSPSWATLVPVCPVGKWSAGARPGSRATGSMRAPGRRAVLASRVMRERTGTVVIGGGIVGCAVAYYLAEQGAKDILVVERQALASGSTGGSFGGVRQQFSTPLEIEFSKRGLEFWRTCEEAFDSPC